jgi:hypothetical protein
MGFLGDLFKVVGLAAAPLGLPAWVGTLATVGAAVTQVTEAERAAREQKKLLAAMYGASGDVRRIVLALSSLPPPAPLAPRVEAAMRANLQTMLSQYARSAPAGVDVSGARTLLLARGLAGIANAYNQQMVADQQAQYQHMMNVMQMQLGALSGLPSMYAQPMAGWSNLGQLYSAGAANAIQLLSQLLRPPQRPNPQAQLGRQLAMYGASAALAGAGMTGASLLTQMMARGLRG